MQQERYIIGRTLGESGKGVFMEAYDRQEDRPVFLRLLYRSRAADYAPLAAVRSPYVARVYQVLQEGEDVLLVQEYLEGRTLRSWLEEGRVFSEGEIAALFLQLCHGLEAFHGAGLIHRDVKPENIFLCGGRAVLMDFDAARQYKPGGGKDTTYLGTEGYAAPEQYGFAQTDFRTDIYALGVVVRELCGARCSSRLGPVVDKCTAFDPAARYRRASEVARRLEQLYAPADVGRPPVFPAGKTAAPAAEVGTPAPPPGTAGAGTEAAAGMDGPSAQGGAGDMHKPPVRERAAGGAGIPMPYGREPAGAQAWSPAGNGKRGLRIRRIAGGAIFALIGLLVLAARQPFVMTAGDYLLSRWVYFMILLPVFLPIWNPFRMFGRPPLFRRADGSLRAAGVLIYIAVSIALVIVSNLIAYAFYSPGALEALRGY